MKKKIKLINDVKIMGYGILRKGEVFNVESFNSRFVYIRLTFGCVCRLSRKEVERVR